MYYLTTYRLVDGEIDDCRTVASSRNYVDLFDGAIENFYDIYEDGYYQYAVITSIEGGFYPTNVNQQWFKYNKETDKGEVLTLTEGEEIEKNENIKNYYIIG